MEKSPRKVLIEIEGPEQLGEAFAGAEATNMFKERLGKSLLKKIRSLPRKEKRKIHKNMFKFRRDEVAGANRLEKRQNWRKLWNLMASYNW